MNGPLYVLASGGEAQAVLRRLARDGWQVRDGFALPDRRWDVTGAHLVLHGRVADREAAEQALHAAVRGAGIVAVVDERSEVGRLLVGDLRRIGPVRRRAEDGPPPTPAGEDVPSELAVLAEEQRALLERLANGETIAAAAAAEFLSLRTANRRIAQARETLGVRTTREAVLAYVRLTRG